VWYRTNSPLIDEPMYRSYRDAQYNRLGSANIHQVSGDRAVCRSGFSNRPCACPHRSQSTVLVSSSASLLHHSNYLTD
jgi:hypothetical protein